MSVVRLFFAVPAPEARALAEAAQDAISGLRASLPDPEGLHLTLAFLGNQDPGQVEALLALGRAAASRCAPFPLRTAGLGGFPRTGAARLLYLAFEPQPRLDALAAHLREALRASGVAFDARPFRPHLTLARMREPLDASALSLPGPPLEFQVREAILYRSLLLPGGSRYEPLGSCPLG
jgi:2'-5' RNA ligase